MLQGDLGFLDKASGPYTAFLLVTDPYSLKIWARPLKSKKGPETAEALKSILSSIDANVQTFESDKGKEFDNSQVRAVLKDKNIRQRFKYGLLKARQCFLCLGF